MKLFKKLMAGAMAIAMLSAYTVAFAGSNNSGGTPTASGSSSVTLQGNYGGSDVFLMKLPTAAANASLIFTIDPKEAIKNSPPENAITTGSGASTYGTVIFSTTSGNAAQNTTYSNTSTPLKVMSMSSMDVTVNMIATLSDSKMKFSTTSGFTGSGGADSHLYLGVQVSTLSGGNATPVSAASGGLQAVTAVGAMQATTLKAVPGNFKSVVSGGQTITLVSGAQTTGGNANAAGQISDDKWTGVQYTVIGYANPNADWLIDGLAASAPALTIKWVIDKETDPTYEVGTFPPAGATNYTAKLDKAKYKAGETATVYVKPNSDTARVSSVVLNYIALNNGKMARTASARFTLETTKVNGAYVGHLQWPSDMAKNGSPAGDITTWTAPTWTIEVS